MWFARTRGPTHAELGVAGELLAARFLRARGLVLLGRRVATSRGEIDLVLLDAGRLVCVEVKTALGASGRLWSPGERWRATAFERHRRAALALAALGLAPSRARPRLDLIEVFVGVAGRPEIRHHRDLRGPPPLAR